MPVSMNQALWLFTLDSGEQYQENAGKNGWENREIWRVLSQFPPPPSISLSLSHTHLTQNENLSNRTLLVWSEDPLHGQFFMSHIYYTKQKRIPTTRNHQCEVFCCPYLLLRPTHVQQDWQTPRECHTISEQQTICIWKCLCAHHTKLHTMNK